MGISVENLIRIRTVNTAPDQDIRNNKPDEPRSYTDDEIEKLFPDEVDNYANYMSRADAIKKQREMQYNYELSEIRGRPGSGTGYRDIYEKPDDPLELARENQIVDDRNAADQAAQDAADAAADAQDAANRANPANAGKGATMRELMAVSNSESPDG
jgi:hypothetical protein